MTRLAWEQLELGAVIGTGTVGTVYHARMKRIGVEGDQDVAVKVLQESISEDALVRKRFRREMEILERLHHPHIIHYFGGGEHEGKLFFAMELVDGGNVKDLLERYGPFSWQEAASVGRQVCAALQFAHNNGIIHRDLKPGNLFLTTSGTVKLGDFGIARDTLSADITSQGLTVGTHAYMSPEQIRGETPTGKADLYSLGNVLFELLTGIKAFDGVNFAVIFEQHLHVTAPPIRDFVPDCPEQLCQIVAQLLEKQPDKRPFNARAVQGVLSELLASYGLKSDGVPASKSEQDVPASAVVEQEVIDPGMSTLRQKLVPEAKPEFSWKVLVVLAVLVLALIGAASIAG